MSRSVLLIVALMMLIIWLQSGGGGSLGPESVDLGTARYPEMAGAEGSSLAARVAQHVWRDDRFGSDYHLAFAHGLGASSDLDADHDALGKRFRFRWQGDASFRWQVPQECAGREWSCIYSEVLARSQQDLEPVVERIEAGFREETWTTSDAARWLLAFVQQIPYKLPTKHAFGVLPPALVVSKGWGDCDSKSLLLIHLLDRLGIEAIMLTSEAHTHALVGISVPTSARGFKYRGREYAWAETTTEDAPLGWLHPSMRLPFDWRVVSIPQ
jgi:hypothetical protein